MNSHKAFVSPIPVKASAPVRILSNGHMLVNCSGDNSGSNSKIAFNFSGSNKNKVN